MANDLEQYVPEAVRPFLVAIQAGARGGWTRVGETTVAQARAAYDAGTHEMAQGALYRQDGAARIKVGTGLYLFKRQVPARRLSHERLNHERLG